MPKRTSIKFGSSGSIAAVTATAVLLAVPVATAVMFAGEQRKVSFKLSEICIAATAFVIMIKSGIQLRLDTIHEDGIFLLKVVNSRLTTNNSIQMFCWLLLYC